MIKNARKILIVTVLLMAFSLLCGFDSDKDRVIDDANILSDSEIAKLNDMIDEYINDTELDLVIYTNNNGVRDYEMQDFSDKYYDENGFGYDKAGSGAILVIDMSSRQMYISTKGIAIWYLDDVDIDDILDDVQHQLQMDRYYKACKEFLDDVHSLAMKYIDNNEPGIDEWKKGNYSDYSDFYYDYVLYHKDVDYSVHEKVSFFKKILGTPWICLVISLGVGGIAVLIMSYNQKSKMTADGNTYLDKNSYNLKGRSDVYTHTQTVKHLVESSNGGGGGGGSFHSSGGGSHGGGGRGF